MTDTRREKRAVLAPTPNTYRSISSGSDSSADSSATSSPTIRPVSAKQPLEVTATFRGLSEDKPLKKIALAISVGKEKHEGANFDATLVLLNKHYARARQKFELTIILGGSLQRHNFWHHLAKFSDKQLAEFIQQVRPEAFISIEEMAIEFAALLKKAAIDEQKEYVKRIESSLAYLTVPEFKITDWDDWFKPNHPAYARYTQAHAILKTLHERDPKYQQAIQKTTDNFLRKKYSGIERLQLRMSAIDNRFEEIDFRTLAHVSSRNYLIEEMPLIMLEWEKYFSHIAYPNSLEYAFKFLQDNAKDFGDLNYQGSLAWLEIDIQNVKPEKKKEVEPIRGNSAALKQFVLLQHEELDSFVHQEAKTQEGKTQEGKTQERKAQEHKVDHGRHTSVAASASSSKATGFVSFPPLSTPGHKAPQAHTQGSFGFGLFEMRQSANKKKKSAGSSFLERASSLPDLHHMDSEQEVAPPQEIVPPSTSPKEYILTLAFPFASVEAEMGEDGVSITPRTRDQLLTTAQSAAQSAAYCTFVAIMQQASKKGKQVINGQTVQEHKTFELPKPGFGAR